MAKRLLDCAASDFSQMTKAELLFSIAASEGRVLASETIGTVTPLLGDVTNAELAAALGADILLLNLFDVDHPQIQGLPNVPPNEVIREVKRDSTYLPFAMALIWLHAASSVTVS